MVIAHVIRIGPAWLRVPLLVLLFPMFYVNYVIEMPAMNPSVRAIDLYRSVGFWIFPLDVWLAAALGKFVPDS